MFKIQCIFIDFFHLGTKSDACVDGKGCHFFENAPKSLCLDDAVACPVTCGCCCKLRYFHRLRNNFTFSEGFQNDGLRTSRQFYT
jgi:hypothetical protein